MDSYFDQVETGSPDRNRKADALRDVLGRFEVRPEEAVYIGDAFSDITECQAAGVPCLSAAWAVPPDVIRQQEEMNPGMVLYSIQELRNRLFALISK